MQCANNHKADAQYRCAKCKKAYCEGCVEFVDDVPYCFNCLKGIAKETLREKRIGLSANLMTAAMIAIVIAVMSLVLNYQVIVSLSRAANFAAFFSTNGPQLKALVYFILFFSTGVGVLATKQWSFYTGLFSGLLAPAVEVAGLLNGEIFGAQAGTCSLNILLSHPISNCTSLFVLFILGPLVMLLMLVASRRQFFGKA